MIVSLMYHALFPFTRFLSSVAERWRSRPCVCVNGREVGDGLGEQHTHLHCHSSTRIIPTAQDTEGGDTRDMLQRGAPPESREGGGDMSREELKEEVTHDEARETLSYVIQMEPSAAAAVHGFDSEREGLEEIQEVASVPAEGKRSASVLGGPLGVHEAEFAKSELQSHLTSDDMLTSLVRGALAGPDDTTPPETQLDCADIRSASPGLAAELHLSVEGGDATVKTGSPICDDDEKDSSEQDPHPSACSSDILLRFASENEALFRSSSPVFDLRALLAEAQGIQLPVEPVGWHFPVGLGLADTYCCPYVPLPGISYYPTFQSNDNIEVMWRVWEDLSESSSDSAVVFEFTVMSYNILSQELLEASPELYTHCTEEVLQWDRRLNLILQELHVWEPDVVCLQEVEEKHFLEQMFPVLTQMGYTCIYKRRTGTRTDGCAVCYQRHRFTQLSVSLLEFRRSDCQLLNRDNVGIVLLLQPITEQGEAFSPVCVANTHLLFNPRRGDVKLAQLAILLAEIDSMINKCEREGKSCEVLLCGDFNALPNTPLWDFITSGELYYHGLPAWMVSGQVDLSSRFHHRRLFAPLWPDSLGINESCQYSACSDTKDEGSGDRLRRSERLQYSHSFLYQLRYCQSSCVRPQDLEFIPGVTDNTPDPEEIQMFSPRFGHSLCHSLNVTSAYPHTHPITQRSEVTTLNSEAAAMVDYIFYSTQRHGCAQTKEREGTLKLLGRLSLLSEADVWSLRGLPSEVFPSDHLSLLVKFQLSAESRR